MDGQRIQRIHITGGPGSGKTWLAARLRQRIVVPCFDQDGTALALLASLGIQPLFQVRRLLWRQG